MTDAGGDALKALGLLESTKDHARGLIGSKSLVVTVAPRWDESAALVVGKRAAAPISQEEFHSWYNDEKRDNPRAAGNIYSQISFGLKAQRNQVVELTDISAVEVKRIAQPKGVLLWSPPGGGDSGNLTLGLTFQRLPSKVRTRAMELNYKEDNLLHWKDLGPYPGYGRGNKRLKDQEGVNIQVFLGSPSVPASFKIAISHTVGGKVQPPLILGNEGDGRRPFRIIPLCSMRAYIEDGRAYTIDLAAARPGVVRMAVDSMVNLSRQCPEGRS